MLDFVDLLTGSAFTFGGLGAALAAVLVLAVMLVTPRGERARVRLPLVLLVLHLITALGVAQLPLSKDLRSALHVTALFLLLLCLGRCGFVLVVDWFLTRRLNRPLPRIFRDIVQVLVYFGVAFVTFRAMGAELGSLLTTSAVLTAVLGLSLQETLGNLFAGLAIQAQQPFQVGDWIEYETTEGTAGKVVEINWRATRIITADGVEIVVPNALLAKSPIRNYTQPTPISRRRVSVQGPYDVAPHLVEAALMEAARGCQGVLPDPPPSTWVCNYGDSGIDYSLVFYIDDFSLRHQVDSSLRRRIWYALQRAGISVPFPVRDVRVEQVTDERRRQRQEEQRSEIARMLQAVDFFEVLPADAIERLARSATTQAFVRGEDIIRQGEEGTELFVIRTGEAVVLVESDKAPAVEVARLGPGDFFGEMSLMTGERRNATVRAVNACELAVVGHEPFREVLAAFPDLAQRISESLESRQEAIASVRSARESLHTTAQGGVLLTKIRSFFSLWPTGDTPPRTKR